MVNNKHIATFILGALAGLAAGKYTSMSEEEKEQMMNNLKEKANKLKEDASKSAEQAKDYFSELATKGMDSLKEHFPGAEKWMSDLFGNKSADSHTAASDTGSTEASPS
ncbi:hypothetical protein [Niabella drilacis]|uniref:YtxH-like protein n=1 Tax=Niabella drilacis (strain DSM 25811 / CCM 8410 / CCUG 62505 / LMG 26954 / E90) TaxID=1285928 RepID=A0A1G6XGS2_NIADE|nr:hypothetical protein [Niabella drilacis]SDD76406.1 hypothetical protein SAMN04487894_11342 [Niabella drilacis]